MLRRFIVGLAVLAAPAIAARAAELPFIEVDPQTRTALRERETRRSFVAVGLNYFDHETGWAPKLWQKFDESRVAHHLDLIRQGGFNTIRVFLTYASHHSEPGKLDPAGLEKLRRLLALCRERGIYVIPTGADHWEGMPGWRKGDRFTNETILKADEAWWTGLASALKDESAILAWDLYNEPAIGWEGPALQTAWNAWLGRTYGSVERIAEAWKRPLSEIGTLGDIGVPPKEPALKEPRLLDYQRFRESVADAWTRRMTTAIRAGDGNHLVTVGHVQWAVPVFLPSVWHYAGFDMRQNARHVDFVSIHFYPLGDPWPSAGAEGVAANAVYLEAVLHACTVGKPLMLGEFGWYGGGPITAGGKTIMPPQSPEDQLRWNGTLLDVTRGRLCGWLNWAMADTATSTDLTRWSGIWTEDLQLKPWGRVYTEFAREVKRAAPVPRVFPPWLRDFAFDREALLTSPEAGKAALRELRERAGAVPRPASAPN